MDAYENQQGTLSHKEEHEQLEEHPEVSYDTLKISRKTTAFR